MGVILLAKLWLAANGEECKRVYHILYNMLLWLKLSRCSLQLRTLGQEAPYLGTAVNLGHQNQSEVSYKTLEIGTASGFKEMPTGALQAEGHRSNLMPSEDAVWGLKEREWEAWPRILEMSQREGIMKTADVVFLGCFLLSGKVGGRWLAWINPGEGVG